MSTEVAETMGCGCDQVCMASARGEGEKCPRRTRGRVVDLATREPLVDKAELGPKPYDGARDALGRALEYVVGPRSRYYGHPLDNHGRTATLWNAHLAAKVATLADDELVAVIRAGALLTPEDVCWMNAEQKIARDMHHPIDDGPDDVIGYGANVAEIRAERRRRAA